MCLGNTLSRLPDPSLQPPCWLQRRSVSSPDVFFFLNKCSKSHSKLCSVINVKAEHHKEKAVGGQAVVKCMSQLDEEVAQLYVLTHLFVYVFYKKKKS